MGGKERCVQGFLGDQRKRDHLTGLGVDCRVLLEGIFKK